MSAPPWLIRALTAAGVPLVPPGSGTAGTPNAPKNGHVPPVPPVPPSLSESDMERYEERAAILEFEADMTRENAERHAWALMATRPRLRRVH